MPRIDEPIICPIVVGRAEQLSLLQRIVGEPASARGSIVLVSGEAGIGKTRLVSVARDLAASNAWLYLQGNFFEQDRSLPFAGLIDLLRSFLAEEPAERGRELASLTPELVQLVPELALSDGAEGDPDQDQRRLFRAFSRFLLQEAAQRPVLVALEDLHWADDASLEFLTYFSHQVSAQPLVLLLTYRADEVHASLGHLLTGLERQRTATELRLIGLPLPDVDAMLRAMLGRTRPVRPEILSQIHRLTDGNPFFVEELARSIVAESEVDDPWEQEQVRSERIPRSVNESVQRRSQQLPEGTRSVLQMAAVAGRRFDFELLLALSGLSEAELLASIKELIAAQLVVEDSFDQFSFRHALTRQAVYSALLLRERRLLHARIAATIASLYAESLEEHAEELAYHSFQAEDWQTAMSSYEQAGKRALALYSPAAAVEHFGYALQAAGRLGSAPRREILTNRGRAHETLGDFEAARVDHEAALSEAYMVEDTASQWQSMLNLGMLWAGRDYGRTGEYYERALRLAEETGDRAQVAHSLNRMGNWLANNEHPFEGAGRHGEALAIFEALADRPSVAGTLDLLAMSNLICGDMVTSMQYYRQALVIFEELKDRVGLVSAMGTFACHAGAWHTDACEASDSLAQMAVDCQTALDLARGIGWRAGESYAMWNVALCLGPMGEYARSLQIADAGVAIADEIEHAQWQTFGNIAKGSVLLRLFDLDGAKQCLQLALSLAESTKSMFLVSMSASALALAYIEAKDLGEAETLLQPLLQEEQPWTLSQRQVRGAWTELKLAQGRYEEALQGVMALESEVNGSERIGRLARLRGLALLGLGRYDEAESWLQRAIVISQDEGRLALVWRLQADLASLALKRGDAAAAATQALMAQGEVDRLAAGIPDGAMRQTFLSGAYASIPGLPRTRPAAEPRSLLSQREREVAAMVARGLSNRAMADILVLSERTVESHVANGLSKLGFSSRAQLAAWAVEQGIA